MRPLRRRGRAPRYRRRISWLTPSPSTSIHSITTGALSADADSFAIVLYPPFGSKLFPFILLPPFVAELSLALWLLLKGVDVNKRAAAPAYR